MAFRSPLQRRLLAACCGVALLVSVGLCYAEGLTLISLKGVIAAQYPEVPFVAPAVLQQAMASKVPPVLLDARTKAEFAVSQLKGAVRVDPDAPDLAALTPFKGRPVVTYCSVGYRSAQLGRTLLSAGFRDVRNLEGGLFGWANQGRPLYRDGLTVEVVHPYNETWGRLLDARYH